MKKKGTEGNSLNLQFGRKLRWYSHIGSSKFYGVPDISSAMDFSNALRVFEHEALSASEVPHFHRFHRDESINQKSYF